LTDTRRKDNILAISVTFWFVMLFVPLGVLLTIKTLKVELYFVRKAYKLTMHLERFLCIIVCLCHPCI